MIACLEKAGCEATLYFILSLSVLHNLYLNNKKINPSDPAASDPAHPVPF